MYYKEYIPNKNLSPFIRSYFHVRVKSNTEFRFPSDGCPGLIVNLGRPFLLGTAENDLTVFTGCRLFGYLSHQLMIKSLHDAEALAVKFRPGQLTKFSPVPGIELTDTSLPVEYLWHPMGSEVVCRIYETKSIRMIVQILDAFFLKCLSLYDGRERRITLALDEILKQRGQVTVQGLSDRTNLSRRQFERRFKKVIGLSPKRMCRIARIAGIIPRLALDKHLSWVDLALSGGFSDQAHFIRDWKYFTGASPQSFIKRLSAFESLVLGLN